jgi:copper transport protein
MALPRKISAMNSSPAKALSSFYRGWWWLAAWLAALGWLIMGPAGPVLAHANLVRSEPAAGAVLPQAPDTLLLEFSETPDPGFSSVQLLDAAAQVVVKGPGVIDPSNPKVLRLALGRLPDGTYSAVWKVRSKVDGHVTNGTVGFSVGLSSPPASLLPPPGTPDPATALPVPGDTLMRWLSYLAGAMAVGSQLFGLLVWRPAWRSGAEQAAGADADATRLLKRLAWLGIGGLILVSLGSALVQAAQAGQGWPPAALGASLLGLMAGRTGQMFALRLELLVALSLVVSRLPPAGAGRARLWGVTAGLGMGVLLTFSLQSHGAALGSVLAIALDWLHLVAMAAWLGGLLPLVLLVGRTRRTRDIPLATIVPRFSALAIASVASLALSGLYSAFVHVRSWEALTSTSYGWAVIAKLGLFAILLCLGAVNLLVLSPRLSRAGRSIAPWLGRSVRVEMGVGALVLVAAALLTGVSPAAEALQAQQRQGVLRTADIGAVKLAFRVAPAQVGYDEFGIDIRDARPGAANVEPQVLLRLTTLDADRGTTQVEARPGDGGRYTVRGSYFSTAGLWRVEVILRRSGFDDVRQAFDLPIGVQTATAAVADEGGPVNPIPVSPASLAQGQATYEAQCVPCHGPTGKGDGPLALTLNPRPADLTQHTAPGVHSDGKLYDWISHGIPGSAMPAFQTILSDDERWNVINYIRTLADQ